MELVARAFRRSLRCEVRRFLGAGELKARCLGARKPICPPIIHEPVHHLPDFLPATSTLPIKGVVIVQSRSSIFIHSRRISTIINRITNRYPLPNRPEGLDSRAPSEASSHLLPCVDQTIPYQGLSSIVLTRQQIHVHSVPPLDFRLLASFPLIPTNYSCDCRRDRCPFSLLPAVSCVLCNAVSIPRRR